MHSLLNGSEVACVTTINANVTVTGIEVDPIHGYVHVTSPYEYFYITCVV